MTARVIVIVLDDAGWGDLGCYGNIHSPTPTIDAIAAAGTRFDRYRSLFSVCSPSRATLLTGQSAGYYWIDKPDIPANGQRQWLPSGATTIYRYLKTLTPAPFCQHVGKWHLGAPGGNPDGGGGRRNTLTPCGFGIDEFWGAVNGPNSTVNDHERWENAYIIRQLAGQAPEHVLTSGWITQVHGQKIVDMIAAHAANPAGFLNSFWTHIPHQFLSNAVPEMADFPALSDGERTHQANLKHLDNVVLAIVNALIANGIYDDTHIFITSDNGSPDGSVRNGGLRAGKLSAFEGGVRLPFIWKGPGVPSGVVDTENRLSTDLFVTLAELFGLDASAWPGSSLLSPPPQRDQLISAGQNDALIRSVIGDGRTIKLLVQGASRQFFCVDTIDGEEDENELEVVASGAVAGEINQADADSIETAFDAAMGAYPGVPTATNWQGYPEGTTEAQARAYVDADFAEEPEPKDYRVFMGGGGPELQTALETLAQHPRTISCPHGSGDLTEAALGTLPNGTHPSTGTTPVAFGASKVISGLLHAMCLDPVARELLSSEELAELDARLATTSGDRML